ncbi:hypothetical protein MAPG_07938 [Magnaporthiopsis poae ATCC 64411]|uniref:Uncharacterized protein n=1 Tax=Magnaporthiopsis poae (strain ATCC 64411 / 73-15) TaxID=644358 RepID=A0A0C4E609_MAGP6|nr:hypothetical protein MAPG_07938 [Magnaporthiopsis poae ATCC 64411]
MHAGSSSPELGLKASRSSRSLPRVVNRVSRSKSNAHAVVSYRQSSLLHEEKKGGGHDRRQGGGVGSCTRSDRRSCTTYTRSGLGRRPG